jgi:DNA polymerase-3 subunit epsilon
MARSRHPGQRNNLDALCQRYGVDNSSRDLHGALLDAEILADVYLAMTGGQTALQLGGEDSDGGSGRARRIAAGVCRRPAGAAGHRSRAARSYPRTRRSSTHRRGGEHPLWRRRCAGLNPGRQGPASRWRPKDF